MIAEEEMKRFVEAFPLIRKASGYSAEDYGEMIGVSRQTINNLENQKYKLTKTLYIAARYAMDGEISTRPEETEMLKVLLDALVDHPENYSEEAKAKIKKEAELFAPALKSKSISRKEVSSEWKEILLSLGVLTSKTVSSISLGSWRKKKKS